MLRKRLATPEPDTTPVYPWSICLGTTVYVRGDPEGRSYRVTGGHLHHGWPVLHLYGDDHESLHVAQIRVSTRPTPSA